MNKITLITPPDIFENSNRGILFVHLNEQEQDFVSRWLSDGGLNADLNFYVYDGQPNVDWFFYTLSLCEYKYFNLDECNDVTRALAGYVLAKNNVFYTTEDKNLHALYSHINQNKISDIQQFLEIAFGVQKT